jgi:hypothetical protein
VLTLRIMKVVYIYMHTHTQPCLLDVRKLNAIWPGRESALNERVPAQHCTRDMRASKTTDVMFRRAAGNLGLGANEMYLLKTTLAQSIEYERTEHSCALWACWHPLEQHSSHST